MTDKNNVLKDIEKDLEDGEDLDKIVEKYGSSLREEEFKQEISDELSNFLQDATENSEKIFQLNESVDKIISSAFEQLGFTREEFVNYFDEADTQDLQDALLTDEGKMSWELALEIMQVTAEQQTSEEYLTLGENLFAEAVEQDEGRVMSTLEQQFEWQKFKNGFQHGFYKLAREDAAREVEVSSKLETIKEIYEGLLLPVILFMAQLLAIKLGHGDIENLGAAKNAFEESNYQLDKFWNEDAQIIRNGRAHIDFNTNEDGVLLTSQTGEEYFYSDEEIEDVIKDSAKTANNLISGLAAGYRAIIMSKEERNLYDHGSSVI